MDYADSSAMKCAWLRGSYLSEGIVAAAQIDTESLIAYEAGLRIRQALAAFPLHGTHDDDLTTAMRTTVLHRTIDWVEQFAANFPSSPRQSSLRDTINECSQCWRMRDTLGEVHGENRPYHEIHQHLLSLKILAGKLIATLELNPVVSLWYELGLVIADGQGDDSCWVWHDSQLVHDKLQLLGLPEEDLFDVTQIEEPAKEVVGIANLPPAYWYWGVLEKGFALLRTRANRISDRVLAVPNELRRNSSDETNGYLGLQFDDERRSVSRTGYPGKLDLSDSRLNWALLRALSDKRDGILSNEQLRRIWSKYGTAPNPAPGTINTQISVLSRKIETLGLKIVSKRGLGRRLVDVGPKPPDNG